jgi:predicted DNA-binding transcriptional regulator AlpA
MKRLGLRSSAFDELRHRSDFPKPIYLTSRCPVWSEAEVDAWIAARFAERRL